MGWWLEMQSFLRCYKRVPLPVPRCSSLGYLQATNPPFASVSAPPPSTHLRHASLTVSRSNKRPERKTASAFPNWTCADERSFKRPLAAMEGNGPLHGTARDLGRVVMSGDPVAADFTCARL